MGENEETINHSEKIREAIVNRLSKVIDPETGVDVVRMRLIEGLVVDEQGRVSYTFRPSSPLCPIAVPLSLAIYQAISEIEGVSEQYIQVVDYVLAEELTRWLQEAMKGEADAT